MTDFREVPFTGHKIKLTDFLKQANLSDDIPLGGNVKFLVEAGFVSVDGQISGHLGPITKRTKLTGGEIVVRFGLIDDPDDPRVIERDRQEGPHSNNLYRYHADAARAVAQ